MGTEGKKFDSEKDMWSLLPIYPITQVVKVLTYGATKYAPENWKNVPNYRERYYSACMRHLTAWWEGELKDPETGYPHLAHAICCLVFLLWFERNS